MASRLQNEAHLSGERGTASRLLKSLPVFKCGGATFSSLGPVDSRLGGRGSVQEPAKYSMNGLVQGSVNEPLRACDARQPLCHELIGGRLVLEACAARAP